MKRNTVIWILKLSRLFTKFETIFEGSESRIFVNFITQTVRPVKSRNRNLTFFLIRDLYLKK